jgi:hypothetical protein
MNPGEAGAVGSDRSHLDDKARTAMPHTTTATAKLRLSVGAHVHVRFGVLDPDYPDLSIDGWAGTIVRTNGDSMTPCLVRWDWDTLEHADPIGQSRREEDGLTFEEMWLAEDDLLVDPSSED